IEWRQIEFPLERIERAAASPVNHMLVIGRPSHNNIIRAHSIGNIIPRECRSKGDTLGYPTGGGDDKNLGVTIILSCKGNVLAIVAESGKHFMAGMRG